MAGDGTPPAVYDSRLKRVAFSSREQHESDLRWVIFARNNHNLRNGPAPRKWAIHSESAPVDQKENLAASEGAHNGSFYVGMDSRDSKRAIAHQRYIDSALRSVIDLPCLQQY